MRVEIVHSDLWQYNRNPMSSQLLPFVSFHLRRFLATQPVLLGALVFSLCAFLIALAAWASLTEAGNDAAGRYEASKAEPSKIVVPVAAPEQEESLRPFNSASLVTAFTEAAMRVGIPMNELTFTFDEGKNAPFIRYRVSMTVAANYLATRRFVDQLNADVPDISLDSISCGRKGIDDPLLACDLVFTAFFKKDERG